MMFVSILTAAGALIAAPHHPFKTCDHIVPPNVRPSAVSRVAGTAMMIKIAKSNKFDDFENDMLGRLGLSSSDTDDHNNDDMPAVGSEGDADGSGMLGEVGSSEPTPRSGTQEWGRWSHEEDSIVLDLALPAGVRAKDLTCEVSKSGVMRIESSGEPLLVGTLALPVDRTELAWLVETQDDGSKLLSIELPMLPIDTSNRLTSVDCIFDESLQINGQPCMAPGLSAIGGRHGAKGQVCAS